MAAGKDTHSTPQRAVLCLKAFAPAVQPADADGIEGVVGTTVNPGGAV